MKRLTIVAAAAVMALSAMAAPKALYVKMGDNFYKYNFGVTEHMQFSQDGKVLKLNGYGEGLNLADVEYISFNAPIDETAMTPSAQKEKMIKVGQKAISMINPDDATDLIDMADAFDRVDGCDFPEEWIPEYLKDEYWDDDDDEDEYENVPVPYLASAKMIKAMSKMAGGNGAAARKAQAAAATLFQVSDFFGVFQADRDEWLWKKIADADYFELRFASKDGDPYKFRVKPSSDYTEWTEDKYTARVPKTMEVSFIKGNDTVLGSIVMNSELDQAKKSLKITLNADANGYCVNDVLGINAYNIVDHTRVTIKGQYYASSTANIKGINLTNYDVWKEEMENATDDDEYWDDNLQTWIWVEGNRDEVIVNHFLQAEVSADVLGEIQAKGYLHKLPKGYEVTAKDEWINWEDREEIYDPVKGTIEIIYTNPEIVQDKVDYYNNYCDFTLYYDKNPQPQAYLNFDMYVDYDSWTQDGFWDYKNDTWVEKPVEYRTTEHEIDTLITFPDLTSYSLNEEEYFNEDNFSSLINDFEDLIDAFDKIVDRNEDELMPSQPNYPEY